MVKESSGEILLRSKLDRETKTEYKITVIATDHGNPPQSSSALLIINVLVRLFLSLFLIIIS